MSTSSRSSVVLQGTLVTCNSFATSVYAVTTGKPNYGALTTAAAINSGVSAFTFFSFREYLVSPCFVYALPLAQYERKRAEMRLQPGEELPQLTWNQIRTDKLLDSGASGFATGGLIRGIAAGPRAVLSGGVTAGFLCSLLQYMYNELKVARLIYLSHKSNVAQKQSLPDSSIPRTVDVHNGLSNPPTFGKPWTARMLKYIGIRTLSDEEYLETLKLQRDGHLKKIAELEKELEGDGKSHSQ
ncbi:hypothetical protein K435DRAFT_869066 [Dendrothele bispora CBS 962.96]|uniref:Uncharacterized protein n=1 Tax=Dendrothele bispora (strain CBS 962.96) TaxID=1314807 RepID=A0A4V4HD38_DENBC|nr:hypothetical protein K435DRAFT_869066 [Dendrothele bispora CBS 962.96]